MRQELRVGTRPSRLAIKQAEEISYYVPHARFRIIKIETKGDRDKRTPLSSMEGTDFFTREIEEALISGEIDAAIHSAKDLEDSPPEGLVIAATPSSISPFDCLVSRGGETLKTLAEGAVIGTSSLKRKEAINRFRGDLIVKDIRGDIDHRLEQLDRGDFDAIIAAHAALMRLALTKRIAEIIPEEIFKPHPLQGKLAVQVLRSRADLIRMFERIDEKYEG